MKHGVVATTAVLVFAANAQTITNQYDADEERPRLPVGQVFLYQPETEWTYSHHPHITHFGGRFGPSKQA